MFNCSKCGACCRNLVGVEIYKDLDDGTGTCKNLNRETNLCEIYNDRPLICRIDKAYEMFFKDEMTLEEYYKLNYDACIKLRSKE